MDAEEAATGFSSLVGPKRETENPNPSSSDTDHPREEPQPEKPVVQEQEQDNSSHARAETGRPSDTPECEETETRREERASSSSPRGLSPSAALADDHQEQNPGPDILQMNSHQSTIINGHSSPHLPHHQGDKLSQHRQLIVTNGDTLTSGAIVVTSGESKYSLAGQINSSVLQPHEIYIKTEPLDPMPPLASPATVDGGQSISASLSSDDQLYYISSELVQSSIKSNTPSAGSSPKQMDEQQHHDQQQQQQQQQHHQMVSHSSPVINGHSSPQHSPHHRQLIVTNGDSSGTIVVTSGENKEYSLAGQNNSVLQPHEIYIKTEPLDPMPPLASPATVGDVVSGGQVNSSHSDKNRDLEPSPPATVISLAPAQPYPRGTQLTFAAPAYDIAGSGQYTVQVNAGVSPQYATVTQAGSGHTNGTVYLTTDYITYRDYYPTTSNTTVASTDQYQTVRQHLSASPANATYTQANDSSGETTSFLDRYLRQPTSNSVNGTTYKTTLHGGLSVDLPSPDSGIGEATITPRGENGASLPQIFDYTDLSQAQAILPNVSASSGVDQSATVNVSTPGPGTPGSNSGSNSNASTPTTTGGSAKGGNRRSWHEYGRNSEADKVQIPKIFSEVGFKYYLESPISTSQRREDDRITYINKGQFYGITLEYIPDPDRPLKSGTVKSLMLLVFREEKSHEDEIKAWQFWHSRQHSIKQRILDADTKNSSGIIGPIEEVTHNSIAFYWNPLEGPAKINVAVQCLSTDFSNQKGVKGLPLHLQLDTFDDIRDGSIPANRAYCQIKVFCDKGAERKTRDEERRAAKRKLSATGNGRKKIDEMYHPTAERSEFYAMSDVHKPPVLFTPSEELEKQITTGDINFYSSHTTGDTMSSTGYEPSNPLPPIATPTPTPTGYRNALSSLSCPETDSLLAGSTLEKRERSDPLSASVEMAISAPPVKRIKVYPHDRVLIYAKQENEEVFHPLHLIPPTLVGLAVAIQNKYKLEAKNIRHIFKRCKKGITVQMDDEMVKHYCNEDTVLLEVHQVDEHTHDITLVEIDLNA